MVSVQTTNTRFQVYYTQEIQQGKHTPDLLDSMSKANSAISLRLPKDMHSLYTKCSFGEEEKEKGSPPSSGHTLVLSGAMHRNILSQQRC